MRVTAIDWPVVMKNEGSCTAIDAHGGIVETAIMRYCDERYVDDDSVQNVKNADFESQLNRHSPEELDEFVRKGTAELGRTVFNVVVDEMAVQVGEFVERWKVARP